MSLPQGLEPSQQESQYVHDVYNEIAPHFSSTRFKPWPVVENFLTSRTPGSVGIDVGCGNGKYLGVNKQVFMVGTDRSEGLIECAHGINADYNLGIADGLALPHSDNRFDFAISIAVIHHFSTPERRQQAIAHILSKVAPGGHFLVYCWALEQEKSRRGYKPGETEQDLLVPWVFRQKDKPDETKYRYYHLYKEGELEADCVATGMCTVTETGYDRDNWWAIVERK
ncbi:tRNA (carboxymethyluridine(34)-5-O)-methyltransferase [Diutina catenulata]